jgi:glucose-6-phosphatase
MLSYAHRLLMDHRPFWWVQETDIYGKGPRPHLRQTPLTCETGPGSPSGHMQGSSSVMYVIVQYVIHTFIMSSKRMDDSRKRLLGITLWTSYTLLMILVGLSRLYTVTHFPHQTLLGLVAGNVTVISKLLCFWSRFLLCVLLSLCEYIKWFTNYE